MVFLENNCSLQFGF